MDKSQVRSCINETFPIGYNPLTGNVFIDTTGATLNDVLAYTSSGVVWQAGGGGGVTGSGTAGQIAYWNGSGSITGENALWYDATNDRVGIGTNSPSFDLHIAKAKVGSSVEARVSNTDNTNGASHAHLTVITGGSGGTSSGGDPHILFAVNTAQNYALGIDNSVSGKPFKLSSGANLGTNDIFTINQGGEANILAKLGIGSLTVPTARLDLLAGSTSGANLAIRVRDNGNTFNQFTVYDSGVAKFSAVASTGLFVGYRTNFGRNWVYLTTQDISTDISNPTITSPTIVVKNDVIAIGSGLSATYSDILFFDRKFPGTGAYNETWGLCVTPSNSGGGLSLNNGTGNSSYVYSFEPNGNSYWYATARSHQYTANGTAVMRISSGTAPTSTFADSACIYVNDISAGNAAFHTRAEGGHIFYAGENVGMRSNHDLKLSSNNTVYLTVSTAGLVTLADASNIAVGTTTGTKIGTATTQKIGFWNATPIVQPTTAFASATLVSNGGTPLTDTDTIDGYTLLQLVKIFRTRGDLA